LRQKVILKILHKKTHKEGNFPLLLTTEFTQEKYIPEDKNIIINVTVRHGLDRIGLLRKPPASSAFLPSRASSPIRAFLRSPPANAGMKQYKYGRTQPLLRMGHDHGKLAVETLLLGSAESAYSSKLLSGPADGLVLLLADVLNCVHVDSK
jgi:hypothetical protein